MGKKNTQPNSGKPVKDLTLYESDLDFFAPKDKNATWLSQSLYFHKNNSKQFLDTQKWQDYNKLDRLEINTQEYIDMIDPRTPMGGGGKAEYFSADFKTIPIDVHLDNIARAKLDKLSDVQKIQVDEIDKFAKSQKIRDKDKIIWQREFRELINAVNKDVGLPPIKSSQSPYEYVKSLGKGGDNVVDSVDTLLDYIRSQIRDEQDLALYETYVYKGEIEHAFELGIQHYLLKLNKWSVQCIRFNKDIKNFNRCCGRWYTDETSGRGTVEYIAPPNLYTNPFSSVIGEDITRWNYEKDITFADFVRMFGVNMSSEDLQEVFELNKNQGGGHGMGWSKSGGVKGSNANIRIGYMSVLTQDAEKFAEYAQKNPTVVWQQKPLDWKPKADTDGKIRQKIYNTWYSFYYVPPPASRLNSNSQTDWAWQSKYIFNIHKDIDMYRYGVDMRYAKSTLVLWRDDRPSFTDVKEAFMPKIRTEWHKFQNCIINDFGGIMISQDFMGAVLNAADEGNKINPANPTQPTGGNGLDPLAVSIKTLRQSGLGVVGLKDSKGNTIVDPTKMFIPVESGMLNKAEKHLKLIIDQYNLMMMALAQNDITDGQDAKRTAIAGIQASIIAANNGSWYMEKGAREFLIMYGERCVQHIMCMIKERKKHGFNYRWQEFANVCGKANVLLLEGVEDLQPEDLGISVSLLDVSDKENLFKQLTLEYSKEGKIDSSDVEMIISSIEGNWKYGACLLSLSAKNMKREIAKQEELKHQQAMELGQQQLKIAETLNKAKVDGKDQNIVTQGKVDAMVEEKLSQLKKEGQIEIKQQISDNRKQELSHKSDIKNQEPLNQ